MNPAPRDDRRRTVVTDPDPTAAVEAALKLAIKNLDEKTTAQLSAIEHATALAREQLKDKLETLMASINDKFLANEKLVNQQATANKDLVDQLANALQAALQTQKESASKFENSVADLIKGLNVSSDTANRATNEKIDVLREMVTALTSRIDLGQGGLTAGGDTRREDRELHRDASIASTNMWGIVISIVGVLIAASSVASAILLSRK